MPRACHMDRLARAAPYCFDHRSFLLTDHDCPAPRPEVFDLFRVAQGVNPRRRVRSADEGRDVSLSLDHDASEATRVACPVLVLRPGRIHRRHADQAARMRRQERRAQLVRQRRIRRLARVASAVENLQLAIAVSAQRVAFQQQVYRLKLAQHLGVVQSTRSQGNRRGLLPRYFPRMAALRRLNSLVSRLNV